MKYIVIIFFLLGMYVYTLIPTDTIPAQTPNVVPVAKPVYYDEAGNNCITWEFNPAQFAVCGK